MSIVEKLTEGIIKRDLSSENDALLSKWEKTGLLEGLDSGHARQNMASLLENQAKELLREASTMGKTTPGDVEGFAAVAFPIVRRVFGGLVANDLVSVQPMSLPAGLIFFLDFTRFTGRLGDEANESVYGGGRVGFQITGGVSLTGDSAEDSYYNLNNGYASPTGSATVSLTTLCSGTFGGTGATADIGAGLTQAQFDRLCRFDPDFTSGTTNVVVLQVTTASVPFSQLNLDNLVAVKGGAVGAGMASGAQARRLSVWSGSNGGLYQAGDAKSTLLVYAHSDTVGTEVMANAHVSGLAAGLAFSYPISDNITSDTHNSLAITGTPTWGLEQDKGIPEIDIKVDSISVTAITKKLKAKWTPELQQDINAFHNLDAEVELTSILSETIALEIDQEILEDLVVGATAGTYYWSRKPGKFVARTAATGGVSVNETLYPDFTGTVSEWYETLLETVNDVSAQIHRKTLRGGANFILMGPEVANVMEFTSGFRADTTADEDRGTAGTVKTGTISKKWDVYVDPYFPRNVILVGRKGSSFLESGYVYAPYVPLQTTPTIFDPDDFTPRKGVMTRYAKKMVRPDMYGLVIVLDLV